MCHNNNIILLNTINTYSLRISLARFQNQILLFYIITYVRIGCMYSKFCFSYLKFKIIVQIFDWCVC